MPNQFRDFLERHNTGRSALAPLRDGAFNRARNRMSGWICRVLLSRWKWASVAIRGINGSRRRVLESGIGFADTTLLSPGANIPGESRRGWELQEREVGEPDVEATGIESPDRDTLMPLEAIKPNSHLKLSYPVPRRRRIDYEIEANRPVTTFILDEEGLQEYNKRGGGDIYSYYGGFSNRRVHRERVELPRSMEGNWYLIIQNDSKKEPVAVRYEVFST